MATCPECDAEIEVDEFDVDKGDQLSCPECGSNLEVVGMSPLELDLAPDDDEEDDVEDDEENQSLTRKMLEGQFEVRIASSADEARHELEGRSVNLILMDWSLRGVEDGVTLTRSLRQDERFRNIPVVALTAHALPEDRKLAVATGFDAFLGKPIETDELFRTLDLLIH